MKTKEIKKFMKYRKTEVCCTDGNSREFIINGRIIDTGVLDISGCSTVIKTSSGYFTVSNRAIKDIFIYPYD